MLVKLTVFNKVIIIIMLLLIPILVLYSYSNYVSVAVIEKGLKNSSLNHLSKLNDQMDATIFHMSNLSINLFRDPIIEQFEFIDFYSNYYDKNKIKSDIYQKMIIDSTGGPWKNNLTIYSFSNDDVISTNNSKLNYNKEYFYNYFTSDWEYRKKEFNTEGSPYSQEVFVRDFVEPFSAYSQIQDAKLVLELSFSTKNIIDEITKFKAGGQGDPFLYHPEHDPILNQSANKVLIHKLIRYFDDHPIPTNKTITLNIDDNKYLVNVIKSESLDWYLIDYVPLEEILLPITKSRNLFYCSIILLLLLSIIASYLLYRHIQVPIRILIKNVRQIKKGDFSARISVTGNNEFSFLFTSFNEMAERIQELIEKVYIEKLRSREATLKQLQSQINPHFLYNCLFFIKNMARLGDEEAVVKMALHLGEYYRYTTRTEKQLSTIEEEILSVTNYLAIQKLRMDRIEYEITIPEHILQIEIPRLMLQPIVENAVIHGIEPKPKAGKIKISAVENDWSYKIMVEDDGNGMSKQDLENLKQKIWLPLDEDMGCGMWNVHQRLIHHFEKNAGVHLHHNHNGGLRVVLFWEK